MHDPNDEWLLKFEYQLVKSFYITLIYGLQIQELFTILRGEWDLIGLCIKFVWMQLKYKNAAYLKQTEIVFCDWAATWVCFYTEKLFPLKYSQSMGVIK